MKTNYICGLVLVFCTIPYSLQAGQHCRSYDALFQGNLEQLTEISIATRRIEPVNEASGYYYTLVATDEISRFGYRNPRDIMNRQTGMQIIGTNLLPHDKASMRDVTTSHFDNNFLFFLDGRPIRETTGASTHQGIYADFPVKSLKQIEIIVFKKLIHLKNNIRVYQEHQ